MYIEIFAGLSTTDAEIEAHRAAVAEPTTFTRSRLLETVPRVVRVSREGLAVGSAPKKLRLYPCGERQQCELGMNRTKEEKVVDLEGRRR